MTHFNWIDICAGLLLLRLVIIGVRLGLGAELVKLAGVVAGLFVSFRWYQAVGDWVATRTVVSHEWAGLLALVTMAGLAYVAVVVTLRLIGHAAAIHFAPSLDKVGGGLAAAVRACLVMSLALVALQQLSSEYVRTSIEERSWSGRVLARLAPTVYDTVTPLVAKWRPASS